MYDVTRLDVPLVVKKLLEYREALLKGGVALAEIQEMSLNFQGNLALSMMETHGDQEQQGEAWQQQSHDTVRLAAAAQAIVDDWDGDHLAPHPSAPPDDLEMHFHELRQALRGTE